MLILKREKLQNLLYCEVFYCKTNIERISQWFYNILFSTCANQIENGTKNFVLSIEYQTLYSISSYAVPQLFVLCSAACTVLSYISNEPW